MELPFQDRAEAGRLLAVALASRGLSASTVVLALPRGGVPVAAELAGALAAPLDVLVVRKLGVPWQPELAMGAIAGGTRILDHRLVHDLGISEEEVQAVVALETQESERRERLYRQDLPALELRDCTVVLVDDGLATGSTMVAAARHVRARGPRKLIVAAPVASSQACRLVRSEADECICLAQPRPFRAVGAWYKDFRQLTDDEVREILKHNRGLVHPVP